MRINASNSNYEKEPIQPQLLFRQIQSLDTVNKKLLRVADAITRTSFLQKRELPLVISEFESEIRTTLDQLINSIKEYFVDIDQKVKSLCLAIGNLCGLTSQNKELCSTLSPQSQPTLEALDLKLASLEKSLKQTQENQRKLVQIIEVICQKHEIREQPTLIKNDPHLRLVFNARNQNQNGKQMTSSRPSESFSIHEKLTGLLENEVDKTEKPHEKERYIRTLCTKDHYDITRKKVQEQLLNRQSCFPSNLVSPKGNALFKKSLKSSNPFSSKQFPSAVSQGNFEQKQEHHHRLNFLIHKLGTDVNSQE